MQVECMHIGVQYERPLLSVVVEARSAAKLAMQKELLQRQMILSHAISPGSKSQALCA